jgi:hypothetical protein
MSQITLDFNNEERFYNTIKLSGEALIEAETSAQKQRELVEMFFRKNIGMNFTPFEVLEALKIKAPITSIRRAITNLTNDGILVKTNEMRIGEYGKPNHTWELKAHIIMEL